MLTYMCICQKALRYGNKHCTRQDDCLLNCGLHSKVTLCYRPYCTSVHYVSGRDKLHWITQVVNLKRFNVFPTVSVTLNTAITLSTGLLFVTPWIYCPVLSPIMYILACTVPDHVYIARCCPRSCIYCPVLSPIMYILPGAVPDHVYIALCCPRSCIICRLVATWM